MQIPSGRRIVGIAAVCLALASSTGCTTLSEWVHNGFKVGPNFDRPPAPVAASWIDAPNPRIAPVRPDPAWWCVFNDPILSDLIATAGRDNLDVRAALTRVLEARAGRNITAGQLFPQTQQLTGASAHAQIGQNGNIFTSLLRNNNSKGGAGRNDAAVALGNQYINLNLIGFNATWELDIWGRYRRAIEEANAGVDASFEGVGDALVTLTADLAMNYVQARTAQERLRYARENIEAQRGSLQIAETRFREGRSDALDVNQAEENLARTEASIPPLVVALRQANNQINVLLGRPPADLTPVLGDGAIPVAPPTAAIGIPAELLERRPDVRRALLLAAAQSAQIGVAEADFYPSIGVTGYLGYGSTDITKLFAEKSFLGYIVPGFQWKILNYGRVLNNVRLEEARFQEAVLTYQKTILTAGREAEDAVAGFIQYQLQVEAQERAVKAAQTSATLVLIQYREGRADFNRVFTVQADLATQQDQLATARGNVALSLISIYRALGGGWEAFCPPRASSPSNIHH